MNDMDANTLGRMDTRTEEEFATDVSQFTAKEMLWGRIFREELAARGHESEIAETGADNTGRVIRGRLPNCNPDKRYDFPDGSLVHVEIKTVPESHTAFHTFKVSSIMGCHAYDALILVPKLTHYLIYGRKSMELIMERCDVVHPRAFGGKPCYQPSMALIRHLVSEGLVVRREWTGRARRLIERHRRELAADRITRTTPR